MEDIRLKGNNDFTVIKPGYVQILRNGGHFWRYKNGRDVYAVGHVVSGGMHYTYEKGFGEIIVSSGSIVVVPKGIEYSCVYTHDNTVLKLLNFDLSGETVPEYLLKPSVCKSAEMSAVFGSIDGINMSSMLYLTGKIYELLYLLGNERNAVPEKYRKLLPAINEAVQNYFENRKVSYYSEICGMSEQNFRRLFKEYTGKSFIEYRNGIRIDNARKLISDGECGVSEAAYLTGFNNMAFFYECLKKYS